MADIAVLIPTYRPAAYLQRCLKSLERQTLAKSLFVVYVALNGPRHPYEQYVLEVLSKLDLGYEYFYIPDVGVSNARNRLIESSRENFIAFVDDDDCVSDDYLGELLKATTQTYMGISNISSFRDCPAEKGENYVGRTFRQLEDGETSKYKMRKYFSSPWGKLLHRIMIQDIRFDSNLDRGEDSFFMALISKNVIGVNKVSSGTYYHVCVRDGSSSRRRVPRLKEAKRIVYLLRNYIALMMNRNYDTVFILTRIAATLLHGRRLFTR